MLLEITLKTHREYIPFNSEWAARLQAEKFIKCADVYKVECKQDDKVLWGMAKQ